jgi:hypothetical protein
MACNLFPPPEGRERVRRVFSPRVIDTRTISKSGFLFSWAVRPRKTCRPDALYLRVVSLRVKILHHFSFLFNKSLTGFVSGFVKPSSFALCYPLAIAPHTNTVNTCYTAQPIHLIVPNTIHRCVAFHNTAQSYRHRQFLECDHYTWQ